MGNSRNIWWCNAGEGEAFDSLDTVMRLEGNFIGKSPLNSVHRVEIGGKAYYVKKYTRAGKKLRRYFGRSRAQAEWENLAFFASLKIPTPKLVCYGQRRGLLDYQGVLVTEEVLEAKDLASLASQASPLIKAPEWKRRIIKKLAAYTQALHQKYFVHNDLKWRNILLTPLLDLVFIDCPLGKIKSPFFFRRGKIKDLACLDKLGKKYLTRTDRLRFYLAYQGASRLDSKFKKEIQKVLRFFDHSA